MRKILYTLVLLLFTLTGCSGSTKINIPNLNIVYSNQSILVEKGGYQWTTKLGLFTGQSVIADSASPDQMAEKMKGNEVPGQSQLDLNFSRKPNKVTVVDWSIQKDNSYTFKDNTIIVPKENGTYIYEIIGNWHEGQVSYTIKIIVKN